MAGVRIVTDSACDLTEELAERRTGSPWCPLTIRFGDEELVDRRDLTPAEFWKRCKAQPDPARDVGAPARRLPGQAFEAAPPTTGYDGVVCVTISSELSATYQSALTAAEALGDGLTFGSSTRGSVTMGQGLLALAAAEAAAAGGASPRWSAVARERMARTRVYGVIGTLDHLQRGGRIGGAPALLGSMLSIKPVIQVQRRGGRRGVQAADPLSLPRVPGQQGPRRRPPRAPGRLQRGRPGPRCGPRPSWPGYPSSTRWW